MNVEAIVDKMTNEDMRDMLRHLVNMMSNLELIDALRDMLPDDVKEELCN